MESSLAGAGPEQLLQALELFESLGQPRLVKATLQLMYSIRSLDEIYASRGRRDRKQLKSYFVRFKEVGLGELSRVPIAKLKNWCEIPATGFQVACAEALIVRSDGAGVETIIDLMVQRKIAWEHGLEVLKRNTDCTSGMIRDMVEWDDLEREDDSYLELMEKLSREFHPPMERRARAAKDWKRAMALQQSQDVLHYEAVSGDSRGLKVPFGLILGMVPVEELDLRRHGLEGDRRSVQSHLQKLLHQELSLTVLDVDRKTATLVLSERRASARVAAAMMAELKVGDTREGIVTRVYDSGAFVDLGGVEGLVHKSELSWDPADNPFHIVSVGDNVRVYILSVHPDEKRIELSLKRPFPDPWLQVAQSYEIGQLVDARVDGTTRSGVLVRIQGEIDGFVPASELAQEVVSRTGITLKVGDSLQLRVLRVDEQKHQLIASQTQMQEADIYWGSFRVRKK